MSTSNHIQWQKLAYSFIVIGACVMLWQQFFAPVFSGRIILSQSFSLGGLTVHYYGIILAIAVLLGRYLAVKRAPNYGIGHNQIDNYIFVLVLCGLVGARLYHVASELPYYVANPQFMIAFWNGGLSIYGALLGGILGMAGLVWWSFRKQLLALQSKTKFLELLNKHLNWLTFSVLAGQIVGRFGNLFNYEAFGTPTSLPWKMFVPGVFRPYGYGVEVFYHPWFLYEILANIVIFAILWRWKKLNSALFLWYVLLYNIVRLPLEFLRIDSVFYGPIRQNVVVSAVLIVICAGLIWKFNQKFQATK